MLFRQTSTRRIFSRPLIAIAFAAAIAAAGRVGAENVDSSEPGDAALIAERYRYIFISSLGLLPLPSDHFYLGDPAAGAESITERALAANERIALARGYSLGETAPGNDAAAFERFVVGKLFYERMRAEAVVSTEEVRAYYDAHLAELQREAWFEGAQIFIASKVDRADDPALDAKLAALEAALREQPFLEVAAAHYRALGSTFDGHLGRLERGSIGEASFERFFEADLDAPYFGPLRTKSGYLLGKTFARGEAGPRPFDEVRERIEIKLRGDAAGARRAEFEREAQERLGVEPPFEAWTEPPADEEAIAYRVGDHAVTLAEERRLSPHLYGDATSLDFLQSMCARRLSEDLVCFGPEGPPIVDSDDFRALRRAYNAHILIETELGEAVEEARESGALQSYYEEHADAYRPDDLIRLRLVNVSAVDVPDGPPSPEAEAVRDAVFAHARLVRQAFVEARAAGLEKVSYPEPADPATIEVEESVDPTARPRRDFPPSLQPELDLRLRPGEIGDLVFGRYAYCFFEVLERKTPAPPPLEEILPVVERDYRNDLRSRWADDPAPSS